MRASYAEIKIEEILTKAGLTFVEEYSFPDLVSSHNNPLRFDFAVFDDEGELDFLIEYQGRQHYEPVKKFGGTTAFARQRFNDQKKKEYCLAHGYKLLIIPYWDENKISYDYIMDGAGY